MYVGMVHQVQRNMYETVLLFSSYRAIDYTSYKQVISIKGDFHWGYIRFFSFFSRSHLFWASSYKLPSQRGATAERIAIERSRVRNSLELVSSPQARKLISTARWPSLLGTLNGPSSHHSSPIVRAPFHSSVPLKAPHSTQFPLVLAQGEL